MVDRDDADVSSDDAARLCSRYHQLSRFFFLAPSITYFTDLHLEDNHSGCLREREPGLITRLARRKGPISNPCSGSKSFCRPNFRVLFIALTTPNLHQPGFLGVLLAVVHCYFPRFQVHHHPVAGSNLHDGETFNCKHACEQDSLQDQDKAPYPEELQEGERVSSLACSVFSALWKSVPATARRRLGQLKVLVEELMA